MDVEDSLPEVEEEDLPPEVGEEVFLKVLDLVEEVAEVHQEAVVELEVDEEVLVAEEVPVDPKLSLNLIVMKASLLLVVKKICCVPRI